MELDGKKSRRKGPKIENTKYTRTTDPVTVIGTFLDGTYALPHQQKVTYHIYLFAGKQVLVCCLMEASTVPRASETYRTINSLVILGNRSTSTTS